MEKNLNLYHKDHEQKNIDKTRWTLSFVLLKPSQGCKISLHHNVRLPKKLNQELQPTKKKKDKDLRAHKTLKIPKETKLELQKHNFFLYS